MQNTNQYKPIPVTGYMRLPAVLDHVPVSRSTWWQWVKDKKAPMPCKLSPNVTAWRCEDIRAFIAELGKDNTGVK